MAHGSSWVPPSDDGGRRSTHCRSKFTVTHRCSRRSAPIADPSHGEGRKSDPLQALANVRNLAVQSREPPPSALRYGEG